jgi:hypothetical protein
MKPKRTGAVVLAVLICVGAVLLASALSSAGSKRPSGREGFTPSATLDRDLGPRMMDYTCGVSLDDSTTYTLDSVGELQSITTGRPNSCVVKSLSYGDGLIGAGVDGCTEGSVLADPSVVSGVSVQGGRCTVDLKPNLDWRAYRAYEDKLRLAAIHNSRAYTALSGSDRAILADIEKEKALQKDLKGRYDEANAEYKAAAQDAVIKEAELRRRVDEDDRLRRDIDALEDAVKTARGKTSALEARLHDLEVESGRLERLADGFDFASLSRDEQAAQDNLANAARAHAPVAAARQKLDGAMRALEEATGAVRDADRPCASAKRAYRDQLVRLGIALDADVDAWTHWQTQGRHDARVASAGGWPACDPLTQDSEPPVPAPPAHVTPSAGSPDTHRATVYQHCDYQGWSIDLPEGEYTMGELRRRGLFQNDAISSVKVAPGFRVVLYEHDNFAGKNLVVESDEACLVGRAMNDVTSSIKVMKTPPPPPPPAPPAPPPPPAPVASVYEHHEYQGWVVHLHVGNYTLSQLINLGFRNDSVSSVRVLPGYRVLLYEHDNFRGDVLNVTGDAPRMRELIRDRRRGRTWNDVVSSIKVIKR